MALKAVSESRAGVGRTMGASGAKPGSDDMLLFKRL